MCLQCRESEARVFVLLDVAFAGGTEDQDETPPHPREFVNEEPLGPWGAVTGAAGSKLATHASSVSGGFTRKRCGVPTGVRRALALTT